MCVDCDPDYECEYCGDGYCEGECNDCQECGYSHDECECGGSDGFGTSSSPLWEQRGVKVKLDKSSKGKHWTKVYPTLSNFDPVQAAADYYLLESIVNDVPFATARPAPIMMVTVPDRDRDNELLHTLNVPVAKFEEWTKVRDKVVKPSKLAEVIAQAKAQFVTHIEYCDTNLVTYFHMAIGGELRHHVAMKNGMTPLHSNRDFAWVEWLQIAEQVGHEIYLDAAKMFREFGGGSYGGEAWAVPSEIFHGRLTLKYGDDEFTNKQIFVDRAWTLEHNGGCFLNKIMWQAAPGNTIGNIGWIRHVLDAQAADPTDYPTILKAASPTVKKMFKTYWKESVEQLTDLGIEVKEVEEMKLASAPRPICRFCGSNPHVGHLINCKWVLTLKAAEDCIRIVDPMDSALVSFQFWVKDGVPVEETIYHGAGVAYEFGPDGKLARQFSGDERFTMRFRFLGDGLSLGTWKWEGTMGQFYDGVEISVRGLMHRVMANNEDKAVNISDLVEFVEKAEVLQIRYRRSGDFCYGDQYFPVEADLEDVDTKINFSRTGVGDAIRYAMNGQLA